MLAERRQHVVSPDELGPVHVGAGPRAGAARGPRGGAPPGSHEGGEDRGHVVGVAEPVARALLEQPVEERVERRRHAVDALGRGHRRRAEVLLEDVARGRSREGRGAGDGLVEDAADRIEVGPRVDEAALDQLGRHVRRRPRGVDDAVEDLPPQAALDPEHQPEIDEHRRPAVAEEDVRGLEIAVHDPLAVQERQRLARRPQERHHLAERAAGGREARGQDAQDGGLSLQERGGELGGRDGHRAAQALGGLAGRLVGPGAPPDRLQAALQRLALEELHRVPRQAVLHALGDDAHHASVPDAPERVDLPPDAAEIGLRRAAQRLDGHALGRSLRLADVDDTHAAGAQRAGDTIGTDPRRRFCLRGRRAHEARGYTRRPRARNRTRLHHDPITARHASSRGSAFFSFLLPRAGRFGRWRRPIQASAEMWFATSSTEGLRSSVHHWPTKVTIPMSACA